MEDILRHKKLRVTPFRLEVLSLFRNSLHALDMATVENKLGKFDRVTLYRTIRTFLEEGIIHEIALPNQDKKLALCSTGCDHTEHDHSHQHLHLECKSCNQVFCVETDAIPKISVKGVQIDSLELTAKGLCAECK